MLLLVALCLPIYIKFLLLMPIMLTYSQLSKKYFGGHKSFWWSLWYPCFGLQMIFALDFEGRVLVSFLSICNKFLRFTSSATPVDFLAVTMAAQPYLSIYLCTGICGAWVQDQAYHCLTACDKTDAVLTELHRLQLLCVFISTSWYFHILNVDNFKKVFIEPLLICN